MLSDMAHGAHNRQILASVKRVYGAAFSGYLEENASREAAVVDALVSAAASCEIKPSKTITAFLLRLHRSARIVVDSLHELLDNEVNVHLRRISKRLMDPKTNLSWNVTTNNCQRLVQVLVRGKDFEYLFPRLPKDFGSRDITSEYMNYGWPRYLISFGDRLEGPQNVVGQPNSIVANFCRRNGHENDLIDTIELLQHHFQNVRKDSVKESASWQELRLAPSGPEDTDLVSEKRDNVMFEKLWEIPRDSLSVIQFHLLRPSHQYQNRCGKMLGRLEWIENRLRLLRQLHIFSAFAAGFGAALLYMFHQKPYLLLRIRIPRSQVFGSLRADERVAVIRSIPGRVIYFIWNRRFDQLSYFNGPEYKLAAKLSEIDRTWYGYQTSFLKPLYQSFLECWYGGSPSPLLEYLSFSSGLSNSAVSLVNQRLYGREDWVQLFGSADTVVLMQTFKKNKTVR